KSGISADRAAAAKAASVEAYHLAALVSAGLLAAGAATSAIGLRAGPGQAGRRGSTMQTEPRPPEVSTGAG
ncbi:MAG: hypothetical protein ABIZ72_10205, partial [Candidatus Limnocylindrales bacterium]